MQKEDEQLVILYNEMTVEQTKFLFFLCVSKERVDNVESWWADFMCVWTKSIWVKIHFLYLTW